MGKQQCQEREARAAKEGEERRKEMAVMMETVLKETNIVGEGSFTILKA